MQEVTATITSKFQIHLPVAIRQKAGFTHHGPVRIRADAGRIIIEKRKGKSILDLAGAFRVKNPIPADKIRDYIDYSR
ncbi:AbrB/MazE/SpoVT family DNA-binding domain-containing protein [Candidatus Gottesmanbacteria bacterium]|nr:AbrB/MazE/SpoVT family DNA-binding domain-containing protein [Candidatus Gottesmanbacteria bacterium]